VAARIALSVQIEAQIQQLLLDGLEREADGDGLERLSILGRLGAQLAFQRAVEEEVEAFLRRARFERTPDARGSATATGRAGSRPRRVRSRSRCPRSAIA
jgi:hypothetical protein